MAPSGRYWIDRGESGNKPVIAYCDMERGGRCPGFTRLEYSIRINSFIINLSFFPRTVIVECTGNPCQNGGTCDYQGEGQYSCQCPRGYHGRNCQLGK